MTCRKSIYDFKRKKLLVHEKRAKKHPACWDKYVINGGFQTGGVYSTFKKETFPGSNIKDR